MADRNSKGDPKIISTYKTVRPVAQAGLSPANFSLKHREKTHRRSLSTPRLFIFFPSYVYGTESSAEGRGAQEGTRRRARNVTEEIRNNGEGRASGGSGRDDRGEAEKLFKFETKC